MKNFYYIKVNQNNIITHLDVGGDNWTPEGNDWIKFLDYDADVPKLNKPRIGFIADLNNNIAYPQQPYPSWILVNYTWKAPVEAPGPLENYMWDEQNKTWVIKT
jgi:hypothetical protein